eukprot:TRINITY_DN732_c0_g1_i2.p1 TRINITY_DN732_c0_g1~~TRINITY_DN732_c0_g1_i2.p1  ORF type:complete len:445 (+),score=191.47 TRINITY_DN732_c0_g1_i2:177-1511(+)
MSGRGGGGGGRGGQGGRGGRGGQGGNNAPRGGGGQQGGGGGKGGNNAPRGGGGQGGKGGAPKGVAQPAPKQGKQAKELEVVTPGAAAAQGGKFNFDAPKDQSGFQFNFQSGAEGGAFNLDKLKQSLAASSTDSLPAPVQNRVTALKKLNKKREDLKKQFDEELRQLEIKYEALYAPLYTRRAAIVEGAEEPTAEELGEDAKPTESKDPKGIPDFWLEALKGYPVLEDLVTPRDEPALKFLKDIRVVRLENEDFALEFHFAENPYFENQVLTKKYLFKRMEDDDDWEFDKSECTPINWKADKNLTVTLQKKKQKKRGNRPAKVKVEEQPCESFFNFFSSPQLPDDVSQLDEEELDELDQMLEQDYETGMFIKERLVPQAVLFFTGEAGSFDDEFGFDDDDDDDDEDDDEIEELSDDDDDEGVSAGGSQPAIGGQPGQQPAECKQQ